MSVEGLFTVEEQRALVYEYLAVPHGAKGRFLEERGVRRRDMRRWRSQVFADTLEQGLVPRAGGAVSMEEVDALKRLVEENRALRRELKARNAEHARELAAREKDLVAQRRAVDALGKAIEILHQGGGGKSSTDSAAPAPFDQIPPEAP